MAFKEIVFPRTIAEGATGGRAWNTDVVRNRGGYVKTNANWGVPLGTWEVGQRNRTYAQTTLLYGFFHAVAQGRSHSFRFFDPLDSFVNRKPARRLTSTTFQMVQRYPYASVTFELDITKPIPNDPTLTVSLGLANILDESQYSMNTTTGVLTMTQAVASNVSVLVSGHYHIPVMFDIDHFNVERLSTNHCTWPSIVLREVRL